MGEKAWKITIFNTFLGKAIQTESHDNFYGRCLAFLYCFKEKSKQFLPKIGICPFLAIFDSIGRESGSASVYGGELTDMKLHIYGSADVLFGKWNFQP